MLSPNTYVAGYFAEEVRRELAARYGEKALYQGGLSVRTSLDERLQAAADKSLRELPDSNRHAPPPAVVARHVRPAFEVKAMGDRSHHAGAALRQRMRDVVTA